MKNQQFTLTYNIGNVKALTLLAACKNMYLNVKNNGVTAQKRQFKDFDFCLKTQDGFQMCELNASLRLLAQNCSGNMYGQDLEEMAYVDQWLEFISSDIEQAANKLVYTVFGVISLSKKEFFQTLNKVTQQLSLVDERLKEQNSTNLVGSNLTIADFGLFGACLNLYRFCLDSKKRAKLSNLTRFMETCGEMKCFREAFGKVFFCTKAYMPQFRAQSNQKGGKQQGKKQGQKQGKKGKKGGKKGGKNKQKQKGGQGAKPKSKPKRPRHWSQLLPKCDFNLIDFKVAYSNEEDTVAVFEKFWKDIDHSAYSFWFIEYEPAEGECIDQLKTENLCMLFCQKINKFLRYMFGYMGVYGSEPKLRVQGVWMWRGHDECPEEMGAHPSFEFYTKRRLFPGEKPEDKAFIMDYWMCWDFDDHKLKNGDILRYIKILK